ncbi:MAG: orotidine-5'-phosphate decarboxylase [Acidimicrobiia bacterium]|nr:orotidine-5'-phosphate decarboxylase [Acidimicrobiia bacterium]
MSDEPTAATAGSTAPRDPAGDDGRVPGAERLVVPLDVDDLVSALRLARQVQPYAATVKVGLELYSAAGPDAVSSLAEMGFDVFVDLKMFDIPTTVERAARVVGALGARYLTLHARDDAPMLRAGVEGLLDGASEAGLPEPAALAVTVLTSDPGAPPHVLPRRVALAVECGCAGVVCAAADLKDVREIAPRVQTVVPGIRPAGANVHDQARVATPAEAVAAGADLLVIGRPITQADDPAAAAAAIAASVA